MKAIAIFLCLLGLAASVGAAAGGNALQVGMSVEKLIRLLGAPVSTMSSASKEVYTFRDGTWATVKDGVVTEIEPGGKPSKPATKPKSATVDWAAPRSGSQGDLAPDGTAFWPVAPGDPQPTARFGAIYPFTYPPAPEDVLKRHQAFWQESGQFLKWVEKGVELGGTHDPKQEAPVRAYFNAATPAARQAQETSYLQSAGHAIREHPLFRQVMLRLHLQRAIEDYAKARGTLIRMERLTYSMPVPLDHNTVPESRPLSLMLKDSLARMHYCRTDLHKEAGGDYERGRAFFESGRAWDEPDGRTVAGKTESPWTAPGWNTYVGQSDLANSKHLGSFGGFDLFLGRQISGDSPTPQPIWFLVRNLPKEKASSSSPFEIRCKRLGYRNTPEPLVDFIGQPTLDVLDYGVEASAPAGSDARGAAEARARLWQELRQRIDSARFAEENAAKDRLESAYREARKSNPRLNRWDFEKSQKPSAERLKEEKKSRDEEFAENRRRRMLAQAATNDPEAKTRLAMAYLQGQGFTRNEPAGIELLKEAAVLGDRTARAYLRNAGLLPKPTPAELAREKEDERKRIERLKKEAAEGNAKAARELARAYLTGDGVPADKDKGLRLLREAEELEIK